MVKRKSSETQVFAKRGKGSKSGTGETLYRAKKEKVAKEMSRNSSLCLYLLKEKAASGSLFYYCYSV